MLGHQLRGALQILVRPDRGRLRRRMLSGLVGESPRGHGPGEIQVRDDAPHELLGPVRVARESVDDQAMDVELGHQPRDLAHRRLRRAVHQPRVHHFPHRSVKAPGRRARRVRRGAHVATPVSRSARYGVRYLAATFWVIPPIGVSLNCEAKP